MGEEKVECPEEESATQVNRIFIGDYGEEIIPRDIQEPAKKGLNDERYRSLVQFVEGEKNLKEASDGIKSYQQLIDKISV